MAELGHEPQKSDSRVCALLTHDPITNGTGNNWRGQPLHLTLKKELIVPHYSLPHPLKQEWNLALMNI